MDSVAKYWLRKGGKQIFFLCQICSESVTLLECHLSLISDIAMEAADHLTRLVYDEIAVLYAFPEQVISLMVPQCYQEQQGKCHISVISIL